MPVTLEHTHMTVSNPEATAAWMQDVFGWRIRWAGDAMARGRTIHIGTKDQYLALYTPGAPEKPSQSNDTTIGGLNHIAVQTDDIAAMETRVIAAGFTPGNHGDYEPGRRFYFHDADGIEYEVVQYD